MKKAIQPLSAITFAALLTAAGPLYAAGDHGHGHDDHDDHKSEMKHDDHDSKGHDGHKGHADHAEKMAGMFLVKKEIDGYDVSFHVMEAKPGKEMGGSHNFMIKVEKEGKALTNIVMNTKVEHPNGSSETKKTMKMGDWMMAGYDLGHKGKHKLMILFKTADGQKHKGGVHYSSKN